MFWIWLLHLECLRAVVSHFVGVYCIVPLSALLAVQTDSNCLTQCTVFSSALPALFLSQYLSVVPLPISTEFIGKSLT